MARLYVGTSGWSYPKGKGAWDGSFYPPKLADKDKLAFYAQYFNTVEINSSFYRPPNMYAAKAWAQKVPDDFRFTVKLWQKFTHPKMFEQATGEAARRRGRGLRRLRRGHRAAGGGGQAGRAAGPVPDRASGPTRQRSTI